MAQDNASREAMIELAVNVVAPTVVLMFLSGDDYLGPRAGLVAALAFPTAHGLRSMVMAGTVSPLAVLAFVSVSLTGGIGLLELPVAWFAWKEALFPLVIGLASVISTRTRWPAIPMLLDPLLDTPKVDALLAEKGQVDAHSAALVTATRQIGAIFVATAVATFAFARWMVVSPTGTEAFNAELGRYTALSFPVLGIPSTVVMVWVLHRVLLGIEARTGAEIDDLLR